MAFFVWVRTLLVHVLGNEKKTFKPMVCPFECPLFVGEKLTIPFYVASTEVVYIKKKNLFFLSQFAKLYWVSSSRPPLYKDFEIWHEFFFSAIATRGLGSAVTAAFLVESLRTINYWRYTRRHKMVELYYEEFKDELPVIGG